MSNNKDLFLVKLIREIIKEKYMLLIIYVFICFINFYAFLFLINKIININKNIIIIKNNINNCYLSQLKNNKLISAAFIIICHFTFFAVDFNLFFINVNIKFLFVKIIIVLLVYLFFYYFYGYGLLYSENKKEYLLVMILLNIYTLFVLISCHKITILRESSTFSKFIIFIGYGIMYFIFMKEIISFNYRKSCKYWSKFFISMYYLFGIIYILFLGSCIMEIYYEGSYSGIISYFDLFYYTIVTFATIGFGDVVPCIVQSKIMSLIIAVTSIITISLNLNSILKKYNL